MAIFQRSFVLNIILTFLIAINECLSDDPNISDNMVKMKAVKDQIFNGYDKYIRPSRKGDNTTRVVTALIPQMIIEVDEEKGLFVLDSYFWMTWQDPRLMWNVTTMGYKGNLELPPDFFWLPDISVINSHSLRETPTLKVLAIVTPEGYVYWKPPISTQSYCPGLMKSTYPNDEVECILSLGSWAHDGWQIDFFHGQKMFLFEFRNINPRWELVFSKSRMVRKVGKYKGREETYLCLDAIFTLKRRPLPEIEATRNPCILVMLLTLSVFWLPPNSTKKIHILSTMLLVLTVLLVYVAWSTKNAMGVLFSVSFLQSTAYIVVATFLLQVLLIFNLCSLTGPVRPPVAAMQLLTGTFGKCLCLKWPVNQNLPIDQMHLKEKDYPEYNDSPTPNDDWLLFAAGLDRLFFVIVLVAMISVHHL